MVLIAVFVMGMISVVTCGCNFAIIGVVAGYSGASAEKRTSVVIFRGLAFLAGGVIAMAAIGAMFGFAGHLISNTFGNGWKIVAGVISIFFGLYTMDLLPFKIPGITIKRGESGQTIYTAILFGLTVGGLSAALNSCCNPLFPVILAASFVKGSTVWGLLMLSFFATGYGLPLAAMMVGLSLGVGKISQALALVGTVAKYAGGTALIVLGFYFLLTI